MRPLSSHPSLRAWAERRRLGQNALGKWSLLGLKFLPDFKEEIGLEMPIESEFILNNSVHMLLRICHLEPALASSILR